MKAKLLELLSVFSGSGAKEKGMKLRFDVNQAEAWRRGVDYHESLITIEIDPADLQAEQHKLLQDRLLGIDVCECEVRASGTLGPAVIWDGYGLERRRELPRRIVAPLPTLGGLLEALREDEDRVQERLSLMGQAA